MNSDYLPAMNCYRLIEGYVIHRSDPGGPAAYLSALAPWHHVFKDTIYASQEMFGDAVAVRTYNLPNTALCLLRAQIYRTYVIWGRNWKAIALPSVLLIVGMSMYSNILFPCIRLIDHI